jgi:hypothetical protein
MIQDCGSKDEGRCRAQVQKGWQARARYSVTSSATSGLIDFFFQSVALDRKRGGENGQGVDRNMTQRWNIAQSDQGSDITTADASPTLQRSITVHLRNLSPNLEETQGRIETLAVSHALAPNAPNSITS